MSTKHWLAGISIVAGGLVPSVAQSVTLTDQDSCIKAVLDVSDELLSRQLPSETTVKASGLLDSARSHCKAGQFSEAEADIDEARKKIHQ